MAKFLYFLFSIFNPQIFTRYCLAAINVSHSMQPNTMSGNENLVVFIGGSGRSGSTLIDLLLNNHPLVQSVGEVHRLNLYARENKEPCTCGRPVSECPFWLEVEDEVRAMLGLGVERKPLLEMEIMLRPSDVNAVGAIFQKTAMLVAPRSLGRWVNVFFAPAHQKAIDMSMLWYDAIRNVTKTRVVTDSTKDARRLKSLFFHTPEQFRLIHMVRDGRAVSASAMRRTGMPMTRAAYEWKRAQVHTRLTSYGIPSKQKLKIHYEDLCRDPETTMRDVCRFLGLNFDQEMLILRKAESHNIGGNPMRFRTGEQTIKFDERWRDQLSNQDLRDFNRIAGPENRREGYES